MTAASDSDDPLFRLPGSRLRRGEPALRARDWLAEEMDRLLARAWQPLCVAHRRTGLRQERVHGAACRRPPRLAALLHPPRPTCPAQRCRRPLFPAAHRLPVGGLYPELFTTDAIRLTVEQRVGAVKDGGSVVGAEIGKILASPFYKIVVRIQQQIEQVEGSMVGLRIDEMVIEPRLLELADLQYMALIDPARAMQRLHPERQIVIALDALDEVRYHQSDDNILAWLANCPELPANVRFVLTSRPPDETLRLFCDKQGSRLGELTIAEGDANVTRDVSKFVAELVSEPALNEVLQATPDAGVNFAAKATDKAKGNLGYLDALARGLDQALAETRTEEESIRLRGRGTLDALLSLKELPADLGGLYAFFLHQIKEGVADQQIVGKDSSGKTFSTDVWSAVHDPILGVLAVAAEPLELELIAKLGDIAVDLKWVRPALNRLRQFLDVVDGRYRFYHATVAEFDHCRDYSRQLEDGRCPPRRDAMAQTYFQGLSWQRKELE